MVLILIPFLISPPDGLNSAENLSKFWLQFLRLMATPCVEYVIVPCFKPWHPQPTASAKVSFGRGGGGVRAYYSLPPSVCRRQGRMPRHQAPIVFGASERRAKEVLNNSRGLGDNARIGNHYQYSVQH